MPDPITHAKLASDIVDFFREKTEEERIREAYTMTLDVNRFIVDACNFYGGYVALTMFVVAFAEMKLVVQAAQGKDRQLIESIVSSTIGSFGRTVQ